MEVTAKTDNGAVVNLGKREYWEIGLDLDRDHRLGAWQIKEIIDLSLPPRKTREEQFVGELPEDTKTADVEVGIVYLPSSKTTIEVYRQTRRIIFSK